MERFDWEQTLLFIVYLILTSFEFTIFIHSMVAIPIIIFKFQNMTLYRQKSIRMNAIYMEMVKLAIQWLYNI